MKILVTGGSGFIGSHVIEEIIKRGFTPIIFDRYKNRKDIDMFIGDIRDFGSVKEAVNKADAVINLAAILGTQETINTPIPSVETNVIGSLNVFEACKPTKFHSPRCVQIGVGNYWMNNSYSITKDMAMRFAQMYNKEHGTKIAMLRVLNAYGPRQKAKPVKKIIPSFVTLALQGKDIEVYGDGTQIMDMVYVKDVARALVSSAVWDQNYKEPVDFGTGRRTTVNWIAKQVIKVCNSKSEIAHLPMRPGEEKRAVVLAKNKRKLTKFEDGIKETVRYYENLYRLGVGTS